MGLDDKVVVVTLASRYRRASTCSGAPPTMNKAAVCHLKAPKQVGFYNFSQRVGASG